MAMLLRLTESAQGTQEKELIEQDALTSIILAVTLVEAFTNTYFRVVASDAKFAAASGQILNGLDSKQSNTRRKLREWSKLAFGQEIDLTDSRWKRYEELVERRHQFIHYKPTYETVSLPSEGLPVFVHGLTTLEPFVALDDKAAGECVRTVVGVVQLVGECQSFSDSDNAAFIHQWFGIPSGYDLNSL